MNKDDITDAELRRIEQEDELRAAAEAQRREDKAAAKRIARVFNDDDRPADLAASGVPQRFHPTKQRYKQFWQYVWPEMGADPDGWWYGRCLLHDHNPVKTAHVASAMYNFSKGVMRCMGDPSCHDGKRSMSLSNAHQSWMTSSPQEVSNDAEAR
jgi:hypothetical protein